METMTHTPLNVDLKKMDYETFKTFMRELAQMYSNVKDDAYLLFYHNLRDLAKEVSTLPRNPLIFYGAYEIANNQVVVAIFEMQFTDEVFETEDGKPYQMLSIISSFAEDKVYLRCPTKIRFDFLRLSISYFSKMVFLPKLLSYNPHNLPKRAQRQLCPQLKVVVPSQMMRVNGIEMRMDFMPMEMESV